MCAGTVNTTNKQSIGDQASEVLNFTQKVAGSIGAVLKEIYVSHLELFKMVAN